MAVATSYIAYPTLEKFHSSYKDYFMRFIAGPPGSGKSVASVIELLSIAVRQEPTPEGVRPTKFGIIRSTYGELERTTLVTLLTWLPAKYTKIKYSKPIHVRCRMPLPDNTIADMQFELIAIEDDRDLKKLDSYEATAIWLNEMSGLPAKLVGYAGERVGRYPPPTLWGDGKRHITYYGVIGDYNYPPKNHWLVPYLHEGSMPANTMLFEQPPALLENIDPDTGQVSYELNPAAENLINLDDGRKYLNDLANYQRLGLHDHIQTRLLCRYGKAGGGGKGVFTNFKRTKHVMEKDAVPLKYTNTIVSIDTSGIHPCALFWQYQNSAWVVTDGLYVDEIGFEEFIDDVLTPTIATNYAGCRVLCVCDPANARDARTAITPTDLLRDRGLDAIIAPTNKFKDRVQASEIILNREGKGQVRISPHLTLLIDALDGGYQYKKINVEGSGAMYSTAPVKNMYSHWADAFQYGALHIVGGIINDKDLEQARKLARASVARGKR